MERNVKMKIEVEENIVITQNSISNLEKDAEKKLTVDNQDNLDENRKQIWEQYNLDGFDYFCQLTGPMIAFCLEIIIWDNTEKVSTFIWVFLGLLGAFLWGIWWARFEKYRKASKYDQILLILPLVFSILCFIVYYFWRYEYSTVKSIMKTLFIIAGIIVSEHTITNCFTNKQQWKR